MPRDGTGHVVTVGSVVDHRPYPGNAAYGASKYAVRGLHEFYARHSDGLRVRELIDALEERFHARGGKRFLYQLFPGGPVAQGCRIAGLEPPAGAVDPGFGSVQ